VKRSYRHIPEEQLRVPGEQRWKFREEAADKT